MTSQRTRHILCLSGGKDSTALAIYLRDRVPDLEYLFLDTDKELPETYAYLNKVEAYLGRPVVRLKHDGRGFDHWLAVYRGYLPSSRMRWCTKHLKIQPFERYVGEDRVVSYIGIRADEQRGGYISNKPNITPIYPFKEVGITKRDVYQILEQSGIGLPEYYRWRSRSGCYFCFFQQKVEWVGLLNEHKEYFQMAVAYEKVGEDGTRFTWQADESLEELARPERTTAIREEHARQMALAQERVPNRPLAEVFGDALDGVGATSGCTICVV